MLVSYDTKHWMAQEWQRWKSKPRVSKERRVSNKRPIRDLNWKALIRGNWRKWSYNAKKTSFFSTPTNIIEFPTYEYGTHTYRSLPSISPGAYKRKIAFLPWFFCPIDKPRGSSMENAFFAWKRCQRCSERENKLPSLNFTWQRQTYF